MPNIVFILADDLGYGDVSCLNPKRGKIPTPHIDRLATQGMTFTDAHGCSSVCSPSRYSILTGRYNWRSKLQQGVLNPYDAPLIDRNRLTLPALLRQNGYHTTCIGKWHLGWNWPREGGNPVFDSPIADGPVTRGFDTYFGTDVPNYPPYCFIQNDRTVGIPTVPLPAELLKNNLASVPGPALPGWKLEEILPTLADKACDYIRERAVAKHPFFLYMPLTSPHTPLAVTAEWKGKSNLSVYADFVMETDAIVGRVLDALEQAKVADNTLVVFTSDNGCTPAIAAEQVKKGHYPSAQFRGYKSDIWDGGHRIPLFARWPGVIQAGSTCAQLACQVDMLGTCAQIVGATIPETAGEDTRSMLSLLKGGDKPVRETAVHHSWYGKFAIRDKRWKLVLAPGSGGWSHPQDPEATQLKMPPIQLYDMESDPSETKNLQAEKPDVVERLLAELKKQVDQGRSTAGAPQKNDVTVDIWKTPKPAESAPAPRGDA